MKTIITGGHITPALAVIEEMKKREKGKSKIYEILVVGRKYALEGETTTSQEYKMATEKNIPFEEITTGRLQRSFTRHTIPSLVKIPKGFREAYKIIKSKNPDIILSFGGYLALPICLVGWWYKIPVIIHEQTIVPGLANRIIAFFASKICLSWEETRKLFPENKCVFTGNPVRSTIQNPLTSKVFEIPEEDKVLYITGGSLGSHSINQEVAKILPWLLEKYTVIHQCGETEEFKDWEFLARLKSSLPEEKQRKYFVVNNLKEEEVGWVLKRSHIVIARSGANTITELATLGKIAILIPLPWAGGREQLENAKMLEQKGSAIILPQERFLSEKLQKSLDKIEGEYDKYYERAQDTKNIVKLDAAERIVNILDEIYQKKIN